MSTRSGRSRPSAVDLSPVKSRKGVSPARSPARGRPPGRSPSRKSPSRKSPSRKPVAKVPARKSPSRIPKKETSDSALRSPSKRNALKSDVEIKLVDVVDNNLKSSRGKRSEYSIKDISSPSDFLNGVNREITGLRNRKSIEELAPRRSNRIQENNYKRSPSKSASKSVSHVTFSDEESEAELKNLSRKSRSLTRKLATPIRESLSRLAQYSGKWEFGGRIGSAFLIICLPLTVLSILVSCSKTCSSISIADISALKALSTWYNRQSLALVAGHTVIQVLFALLPVFGTKVDKLGNTGTKYSFNAFFSSIVTISLLFTLDFLKVINTGSILNDYLKLSTAFYLLAVVLAVGLFVKSRNLEDGELNSYGNTGYVIYDFFMGREIHPQIGRLDVKIWISRICNINTLILAVIIFRHGINVPTNADPLTQENYKQVLQKIQLKPTLLLFSLFQIVYVLNFIMREYKITSTFFWQSEGVGYLQAVSSALYPFYFTTVSKYIATSGLELSAPVLAACAVTYLLGFLLMLISNNIKYEFRKNPLNPSLSNLETMPTFHGKKLLISSLWGKLRHPNYTGDILIHIALAVPGIVSKQYVAAAPALLTIVFLLHRALRDHFRCKRRYGAAWQRYCKRVPSLVIPKVL